MSPAPIRIGTRGSHLALRQAGAVAERLRALAPDRPVEVVPMKTSGDRLARVSLGELGGKGLFVKELEEALLDGRVDIAVHSLKDMPAELPEGLCLAAFPTREDPRDVLVSLTGGGIADLPRGATVGTSSLRRRVLLLAARPDLRIEALRGNVDTRLAKLSAGALDAVVVAAAGLARLGLAPANGRPLAPEEFVPAVGQGILAVEVRSADRELRALLAGLDDPSTRAQAEAERAFLRQLGASCHTPVAAHAQVLNGELSLDGLIASLDGRRVLRSRSTGAAASPELLGQKLADELLAQGAREILSEISRVSSRPLAGRRIVITRAREQASRFRHLLEEAGGEVLEIPTIRIEPPESWGPLDGAIARLETFQWIAFTSVNGVEAFRRRLSESGTAVGVLRRFRVAAIGPATAAALAEWGVAPEVVPEEYRAEGLVERLKGLIRPGERVLLPRAAETREVLVKELERLGARVTEVPAYRTLPATEGAGALRSALAAGAVDAVTFTSSSTVRHFVTLCGPQDARALLRGVAVACIGPITADTAAEFGLQTAIMPSEYTIPALAHAIVEYFEIQKGVR